MIFIDFLKIDFRDKLQVQYALGHQSRGLDLYSRESDNLEQLDLRTTLSDSRRDEQVPNVRSKDKEKLIERLRQSVESKSDVGSRFCCFCVSHSLVAAFWWSSSWTK